MQTMAALDATLAKKPRVRKSRAKAATRLGEWTPKPSRARKTFPTAKQTLLSFAPAATPAGAKRKGAATADTAKDGVQTEEPKKKKRRGKKSDPGDGETATKARKTLAKKAEVGSEGGKRKKDLKTKTEGKRKQTKPPAGVDTATDAPGLSEPSEQEHISPNQRVAFV